MVVQLGGMTTPMVLEQSEGGEDGFAHAYAVELLYETAPTMDRDALLDALRRRCGRVDPLGTGTSGPAVFTHLDHCVTYDRGQVPAQTLIDLLPSAPPAEMLAQAIQQSRDWPDGLNVRDVVARCRSAMLVTDFLASGLAYKERLALFREVVCAVMDVAPCAAIHWRPSQRIVCPQVYAANVENDTIYPAVNVRLFNVANRDEGDTVMDSLGLAALGIPDVQCHFRGLDLTAMGSVLFDSAYYLFENGDVIADGHTIQGLTAAQRWRCRHEDALVGPARVVLDLDPGDPYAAGNRESG